MGAVRADWHTSAIDIEEGEDPFAVPIEEVGTPIDLSGQEGRLHARLTALVNKESRLYNIGISCPIKELPDSTCHACPVSQAGNDSRLGVLCRTGREQEAVLTELASLKVAACQGAG